MPRVFPSYGPIASAMTSGYVPAPQQDFIQSQGGKVGDAIGDAVGKMFYNPKNDPRAQQAEYYRAQTEGQVLKNDAAADQAQGLSILPQLLGDLATASGVDRASATPEQKAQVLRQGYEAMIAHRVPPEEATTAITQMAAMWGSSTTDDVMTRGRFATDGTTMKPDEAFSTGDRDVIRKEEFDNKIALNTADNDTKLATENIQSGDRRYNTDQDFAASIFSTNHRGSGGGGGGGRGGKSGGDKGPAAAKPMSATAIQKALTDLIPRDKNNPQYRTVVMTRAQRYVDHGWPVAEAASKAQSDWRAGFKGEMSYDRPGAGKPAAAAPPAAGGKKRVRFDAQGNMIP